MASHLPRILLAFYWFAIFVGTHLPKSSMPSLGTSDKLIHSLAFAGLACLLFLSLPTRWSVGRRAACTFGIGLAYAIFDEFTQGFIPGRETDFRDAIADMVGVTVILAWAGAASLWNARRSQQKD